MKKYGLIGFPLAHSFSKRYFDEIFSKEAITDCLFDLYPIENLDELQSLLNQNKDLKGLAVTIPHKEQIIPFLSALSSTAKEIKSVNCIVIKKNELIGYNTDVIGFERSLLPMLESHHLKALILGTGGASKAVHYVLKKMGIECLFVSRNPERNHEAIGYNNLNQQIINDYTLIVNCTPIGTFPDVHSKPDIPYQFLEKKHLLFDLVYNPEETEFLKEGKLRGTAIKNGMEMLEIQAEENWKIWNKG